MTSLESHVTGRNPDRCGGFPVVGREAHHEATKDTKKEERLRILRGVVVQRGPARRRSEPRPRAEAGGYASGGKNTRVRISMLSRGGALAGTVGSSKAVWAVKRARPSSLES